MAVSARAEDPSLPACSASVGIEAAEDIRVDYKSTSRWVNELESRLAMELIQADTMPGKHFPSNHR